MLTRCALSEITGGSKTTKAALTEQQAQCYQARCIDAPLKGGKESKLHRSAAATPAPQGGRTSQAAGICTPRRARFVWSCARRNSEPYATAAEGIQQNRSEQRSQSLYVAPGADAGVVSALGIAGCLDRALAGRSLGPYDLQPKPVFPLASQRQP